MGIINLVLGFLNYEFYEQPSYLTKQKKCSIIAKFLFNEFTEEVMFTVL